MALTTHDPTTALLQAMADVGLRPMNILWDGAFHRFPGIGQEKGDNGYYKAFVDQRGAVFGDWRTGEQWNWPSGSEAWQQNAKDIKPLSAAEVEKQRKEADAARAKAEKRDTRNILDLWERGKDCKNHPYLEAKGIRNVSFLKSIIDPETEEDMLLIPMRNANRKIRNIQRIWPNGDRQHMPQAGGSRGLYNTIGAHHYKDTKVLYVCEGWATGWTIHMATNLAVIVAFFDGGLKTVGKIIRQKYPEARLIFAADNDRWKPVNRGGEMVNPGVYAAREAAKALDAEYCIPDFPALETKPTDFDDLRQLEDLDAVRKWLKPSMAEHAVTMAPHEPDKLPKPSANGKPKWKSDPTPSNQPPRVPHQRFTTFVDNELADELTAEDRARWIYDPGRGWYTAPEDAWDWRKDHEAASIRDLLRVRAEAVAEDCGLPLRLRAATVSGAINLIKPRVLQIPKWDADPMIAGLPDGGVLDLATGDCRPAKREELVSRRLGVMPDPKAGDPERFLALIHDMLQDEDTALWFLDWIAYTLTGHRIVSDHSAPTLCGGGGAGKSTLMDILRALWGSYGCKLPEDVLIARSRARERHPEWQLMLDGSRLAFGTEIPESGRVRAGMFKELTGGESITTNLMRMNSVEFFPTAKYLFYGNAPPSLPGWDSGLKRRLVFIICHPKPKAERVEGLAATIIQDEGPAILHYLANLCALAHDRYSETGKWLPAPSSASKAETADLFAANNPLEEALSCVVRITGDPFDFIPGRDVNKAVADHYDAEGIGRPPVARMIGAAIREKAHRKKLSVANKLKTIDGKQVKCWLGVVSA